MSDIYIDLPSIKGNKTKAKNETKTKANIAPSGLEVCPDNEMTLPEIIAEMKRLQSELASVKTAKMSIPASKPAIKKQAKKVALHYTILDPDCPQDKTQNYILRQAYYNCQKLGLVANVDNVVRTKMFPDIFSQYSHNETVEKIQALNELSGYKKN